MWVMLPNAFFSIVEKDCKSDELLVRARRKGDIERWFPYVPVIETPRGDYLYRAVVKRSTVGDVLALAARTIYYDNFKNSVADDALHLAYTRVWNEMAEVQPSPPYGRPNLRRVSSFSQAYDEFDEPEDVPNFLPAKGERE